MHPLIHSLEFLGQGAADSASPFGKGRGDLRKKFQSLPFPPRPACGERIEVRGTALPQRHGNSDPSPMIRLLLIGCLLTDQFVD